MAFPVTLNGRTYTLADFEGTNYVDGFPDALEDFVTQAGDIYNDTSSSSNDIGTGTKTFTVSEAKPYQEGTPLRIADANAPETNFLDCVVTSYSGTTLEVNAFGFAGSGTYSSWTINIGGAKTVDGTLAVNQGGTGATSASGARTNLDVYSKSEADSKFLDVSGEASDVTMNGNVTIGDSAADTLEVNATATLDDATITSADINGGTIDGTTIGSTTPAAINGTTGNFTGSLTADSFVGVDQISEGNSSVEVVDSGSGRIEFTTDGSEAMRIDSSGQLGVGTTSPQYTIHAESSTGRIYVKDTNGAAAYIAANAGTNQANNGVAFLNFENTGYSGKSGIEARTASDGSNLILNLKSGQNTTGATLDASSNFKFNSGYGSVATAYGCRAWVNFDGTGTVGIRDSGNVSSITDNGTGNYTVNFTTAMPDVSYAIAASAYNRIIGADSVATATSSTRIRSFEGATFRDSDQVSVAVFR